MGKDISSGAMNVVFALIGLFVFLTIAASLAPTILDAIANLSATLAGVGGIGAAMGVVLPILVVVGLLVAAVKYTQFHVSK
jgi:hypothetical protein